MNTSPPPIVVFAYKRPDHLRKTLTSLAANPEACRHDLMVFCDGPASTADTEAVLATRNTAKGTFCFRHIEVIERPDNLGLAGSITSGISETLHTVESLIVLEDDMMVSPYFLRYMNDALAMYRDMENVASVHAYSYPVKGELPETFFLRGADCWGWGTWRRAWQHFRPDAANLLADLRKAGLVRRFDFEGTCHNSQMLAQSAKGKIDSWAIRWHASVFLHGGLTLYPGRSLVRNIGNDASGTHSIATDDYYSPLADRPIDISRQEPQENEVAYRAYMNFHRQRQPSLVARLRKRILGHN